MENGAAAAAKRALDEGDGAYVEFVKKKLRGSNVDAPAQVQAAPAPAADEHEVNGSKS